VDAPDSPATPGSDLVVYVPTGSSVWVHAATASVDVQGVTGGVDVSSVSGAVHVAGPASTVNVESMDGDVTLDGVTPWLRAHTASGAITLVGGSEDARLTTVGGLVTITGKGNAFRRLYVESVTGNLRFTGTFAPDAKVDFETHSGVVALDLPADLSAGFDLATLQGSILNQFGIGDAAVVHGVRGAEAAFTVGNATLEVKVRSFKGNVIVKRRKVM
jgi:DUF4097 and DUF4098 domain-containing protein YvlB